jgi:hypothetical protein
MGYCLPCSLVRVERRFRGAYSLHYQPWSKRQQAPLKRRSTYRSLYDAISQKAVIFILAAVRTWISSREVCLHNWNCSYRALTRQVLATEDNISRKTSISWNWDNVSADRATVNNFGRNQGQLHALRESVSLQYKYRDDTKNLQYNFSVTFIIIIIIEIVWRFLYIIRTSRSSSCSSTSSSSSIAVIFIGYMAYFCTFIIVLTL